MEKIIAYQVLNDSGFPAGGAYSQGSVGRNDLAIFETEEDAKAWITYLTDECSFPGDDKEAYTVRQVLILT